MKDETVSAEYNWVDGCLSRHLEIEASKTRVNDNGALSNGPVTLVNYSIYNFCDLRNPKQTFYHGTSSAARVVIDSFLRFATVYSDAFPVNELISDGTGGVTQGRVMNISINLSWKSTDQVDRIPNVNFTTYPGYYSLSFFLGVYRMATVTGSITDGVENWIPANADNTFCRIYRLVNGVVTLIKN